MEGPLSCVRVYVVLMFGQDFVENCRHGVHSVGYVGVGGRMVRNETGSIFSRRAMITNQS